METRNSLPRASLPGFVSTAVLTSSDGLFGDNVEEKRVTEAPVSRAEDAVGYRPLYDQLQERRDQKDSEWKEKNNPFAPPKGLDDEEFEYIKDLENKKKHIERKRHAQHEEDLAQFLVARGAPKSTAQAALTAQQLQKYPAKGETKLTNKKKTAAAVVVVKKTKREARDEARNGVPKAPESLDKSIEQPLKKKAKVEVPSKSVVATLEKPNAAALGLVSYGSDSDSQSDEAAVN
ncbi:unnamed protein product [Peronospora belbahrii]|uniref:FAM192A/Fyv6 N-terminal domain-containing protein n=1 Tax=Peronospora belbahrii TaxID=622444 RepID=A0AAU9KQJ5_9STRA|nr:unnamed protein product [Peronospora belbahrii]CAH0515461.1 unnamed protein product [Peronospora belbahrii]